MVLHNEMSRPSRALHVLTTALSAVASWTPGDLQLYKHTDLFPTDTKQPCSPSIVVTTQSR